MKYVNESMRKFFLFSFYDFVSDLIHKFTLMYYHKYHYKCDRLYLANFIYQIKEHLSCRFIYACLFWRQRKSVFNSCRLCAQVFEWEGDSKDYLWYTRDYNDLYRHKEKLFFSNPYLQASNRKENEKCEYFENAYNPVQLVNIFGVISCRIFLNLGKRYFFVGRMNDKKVYRYYFRWTKKLFDFTCNNINIEYAKCAILNFKATVDYDPCYFKIVNKRYIDYLILGGKCA